jgi:hypothetical protein
MLSSQEHLLPCVHHSCRPPRGQHRPSSSIPPGVSETQRGRIAGTTVASPGPLSGFGCRRSGSGGVRCCSDMMHNSVRGKWVDRLNTTAAITSRRRGSEGSFGMDLWGQSGCEDYRRVFPLPTFRSFTSSYFIPSNTQQ